MVKSFVKTLRTYSLITLITLGLVESVLQIAQINSLHRYSAIAHLYKISNRETYPTRGCDKSWWQWLYMQQYEQNSAFLKSDQNMHRPHPTRGWTPIPNFSSQDRGDTYTTNQQGYRALTDYKPNPNQYTILIVGDSFTFGAEIDDAYVWPTLLQKQHSRFNVINLGVNGYGLDQMYITLKETITKYKPDLVITAFISDNIARMRFGFRDYKKPKLKINQGELEITNIPIQGFTETYQEAKKELSWYFIPVLKLDDLMSNLKISCGNGKYKLMRKVFLEMQNIAHQENAEFLLTYLPTETEIKNPDNRVSGEQLLNRFIQENNNVHILNTRLLFLKADQSFFVNTHQNQKGHYQKQETQFLSKIIYQEIQKLQSWKNFKKSQKNR